MENKTVDLFNIRPGRAVLFYFCLFSCQLQPVKIRLKIAFLFTTFPNAVSGIRKFTQKDPDGLSSREPAD